MKNPLVSVSTVKKMIQELFNPIKSMFHSYKNHLINLQCKPIHWFQYECIIGLIWVNANL